MTYVYDDMSRIRGKVASDGYVYDDMSPDPRQDRIGLAHASGWISATPTPIDIGILGSRHGLRTAISAASSTTRLSLLRTATVKSKRPYRGRLLP
jgi:hypothetical protein